MKYRYNHKLYQTIEEVAKAIVADEEEEVTYLCLEDKDYTNAYAVFSELHNPNWQKRWTAFVTNWVTMKLKSEAVEYYHLSYENGMKNIKPYPDGKYFMDRFQITTIVEKGENPIMKTYWYKDNSYYSLVEIAQAIMQEEPKLALILYLYEMAGSLPNGFDKKWTGIVERWLIDQHPLFFAKWFKVTWY